MARKSRAKSVKSGVKSAGVVASPRWPYALLISVSMTMYAHTIGHDFVLDDAIMITENAYTKNGLAGLVDIFTNDSFRGFFQVEGKDKLVAGGRYRPLTHAMFALEYGLFGHDPMPGHLLNIVWYAISVCFLYVVLLLVLPQALGHTRTWPTALLAALFFAVHPIHTEVVANIKGRDEMVAMALGLVSLFFGLRGLLGGRMRQLWISAAMLFAAILAKESAIIFLALIPLTYVFFYGLISRHWIKWSLPWVTAMGIYALWRLYLFGFPTAGAAPMELMNNPFVSWSDTHYSVMSGADRWSLVVQGLTYSLRLLVWPHPLTHDYYPRWFEPISWLNPSMILQLLGLSVLLLLGLLGYRRYRLPAFCIWLFMISILPTSNIVFPVGTHISERFLFTPSIGICLLMAWACHRLSQSISKSTVWVLAGVIMVAMAFLTVQRNFVWKDNFTLFTTDVTTSARSAKAHNSAGGALIDRAAQVEDAAQREVLLNRAISHLHTAIDIHPTYKNAYLLLGNAYYYQRDFGAAIVHFDHALKLDPNYEPAMINRAYAHRDRGRQAGEVEGNLEKAISDLEKAYEQLHHDHETNRLLGIAWGNSGQAERAIPYFARALEIRPEDAQTMFYLGLSHLTHGDSVLGSEYIARAKSLNEHVGE